MAITLLNAVNEILRRTGVLRGDTGDLSSLSDSARQRPIDVAIQCINEATDHLYQLTPRDHPNAQSNDSITLVAGTRAYALNTGMVRLQWPLIDTTNGQYITEYPGGYHTLYKHQSQPANYTGLPTQGAINPTNGQLYLDRIPQASDAGKVYNYNFTNDVAMSASTDTTPYDNPVFRALLPAVVEMWKQSMNNGRYDPRMLATHFGRAANLVTLQPRRETWLPQLGPSHNVTDPFDRA